MVMVGIGLSVQTGFFNPGSSLPPPSYSEHRRNPYHKYFSEDERYKRKEILIHHPAEKAITDGAKKKIKSEDIIDTYGDKCQHTYIAAHHELTVSLDVLFPDCDPCK